MECLRKIPIWMQKINSYHLQKYKKLFWKIKKMCKIRLKTYFCFPDKQRKKKRIFAKNISLMASIRKIKKEINFLFETMITDSIMVREIKKYDEQKKNIESLIMSSIDKHKNLILQINHPESKNDDLSIKQHYNTIAKEAIDFFDTTYKQLNDIIQEK